MATEKGNLDFIETFTIDQFKAEVHVEKLQVKKNPKTGLLFFTYGAKVGAVASAGIPKRPMVSLVNGDSGKFYLLHEEGTGGAPVIAEF